MRGRALLMYRLVASSLRRRPAEVALTVVAIAAATTTLMLGLALHDVTAHPYQTTRALTSGPDVAAMPSTTLRRSSVAQLDALEHRPGVVSHVGPFPVSYPMMTTNGSKVLAIVEGRSMSRSPIDQPYVTQGTWVRPGGVVIERSFAHELSLSLRRSRDARRALAQGGRDRRHRRRSRLSEHGGRDEHRRRRRRLEPSYGSRLGDRSHRPEFCDAECARSTTSSS